ncbi:aminotransferase [Rhodobacterales bacterium 52_120_T64]|nr:aminotransferase [Rhodobacterales bacterium 52_120_T64]
MQTFSKPFTLQEPIPEEAIKRAVEVMRSGRLHRYNTLGDELSETSLLESEFAEYLGAKYCLACASGGYALHIALLAAGLQKGERVLSNAFTLSPVPGAINNAGGIPILVGSDPDYKIDINDLRIKARDGSKFLLLSHMRGHIPDMDEILSICTEHNITLIEDCAHTLGARWKGKASGTFGQVACFSTQTYKHLNSGEGGLLVTDDPDIIARAVLHSGSYMFYEKHPNMPGNEVFERHRLDTPNYSGRMDNLRAAILRVQMRGLDENCRRWNVLYTTVEQGLRKIDGISLPERPQYEEFVGSSIQFTLLGGLAANVSNFLRACTKRGVEIKWFGSDEPIGFTSRHESWHYLEDQQSLEKTNMVLDGLCDLRLPLTFDQDDCNQIVAVIAEAIAEITASRP